MKNWKFLIYAVYVFSAIFALAYDWCDWYVAGVFTINVIKFLASTNYKN